MDAVLDTKLYPPHPAGDLVPRPHLLARLNIGLERRLTLVSAPAGYGKSTLVASWLQSLAETGLPHSGAPVHTAWYSLDPSDNDLPTFVSYLLRTLRDAWPESAVERLRSFAEQSAPGPEQVASGIATACLASASYIILALEDYHVITNPDIQRLVQHLVRHAPANLHLVIVARADPPLRLSALRATQNINEIRASQLRFSADETQQFLGALLAEPVDRAMSDEVHERTEGWVVGLRLAGMTLRTTDADIVLRNFGQHSNRYIIDYLVDEVLGSQPPDSQDFLLRTSILRRFDCHLAAAVMGNCRAAECQHRLESLARQNLFIVALDDHHGWYRYHHQLQAMLQNRLRAQADADELAALHQAAARWFASQGLLDDSLRHYLTGGHVEAAARLIEESVMDVLNVGRTPQLARWLSELPCEVIAQRPGLLLAQAWVYHYRSALSQIPPLLSQAEHLLHTSAADLEPRAADLWRAHILALRSSRVFAHMSPAERIDNAQRALALLPPGPSWLRGSIYQLLARAMVAAGQAEDARRLVEAEIRGGALSLHYLARLQLALASLDLYNGSVSQLADDAERLRAIAHQAHLLNYELWGEFGLGQAAYEAGDLDRAAAHLETVFADSEHVQPQMLLLAAYTRLSIYGQRGEMDAGRQVLDSLRHRMRENVDARSLSEVVALDAYWTMHTGDRAAVAAWARLANRTPAAADDRATRYLVLARSLLYLGTAADLADADQVLSNLEAFYTDIHHLRNLAASLVLRACVYWQQGATRCALATLRRAVDLAAPLGSMQAFAEQGAVMVEMLTALERERPGDPALARLLDIVQASQPAPVTLQAAPVDRELSLIEPLTDREIQILQLLNTEMSNKEIARELSISPLTVRNHTANIYGKLQVAGRRQAVQRARQLGFVAWRPTGLARG